ncbi:ribonuclease toxin immunity protein CdiI [Kluyvera cryocrescens]|uniref:ribonuclease toxin immunity protein CdiI n=1 Tax=Kluyvera cryocrescens TaxID=580 RepID=UPI00248C7732|nr:ribonuclease toxin immunity protein CdiI [Kluyvera cryocrescens]MEB6632518.1 ribonuclease toxin immunity protein CdiI [Kluyvera cryocrescens]
MKVLFDLPYIKTDRYLVIKSYFDLMYNDDLFLNAVESIVKKHSFMRDGVYCFFPDMNSYDESEHFEGVEFAVGYPPSEAETINVSEEICYHYVRQACERYLKIHPENAEMVNSLLDKITY